jgi:hypothetical protein
VGRPTYYCQVPGNVTQEFAKGVIMIPFKHEYITKIKRCISYSDKVWIQGSRGGVKIIKDRETYPSGIYGYITKNEDEMKKFMWAKLKSRSLANYT